MKTFVFATMLLASASIANAAPEPVMSQADTDAIANAIANDAKAPTPAVSNGAGCEKPMRDGRCPPVSNNRQFVFGTPAAGATKSNASARSSGAKSYAAPKAFARPMELGINFVVGSAQLTEASKRSLDRLATSFTKASTSVSQFFVDGHTDRSGTCEANLKLSQDRAATAVDYLATAGVDRARMTPRGFGFQELKVASNPNSGANRRVEVVAKKPATEKPLPSC